MSIRVLAFAIFLAVMLGLREVIKAVVDLGFSPWLMMMVGIFWMGITIENGDRRRDGRAPYSAYEAGQEVRRYFREPTPYILLGLVAFAFLFSRVT